MKKNFTLVMALALWLWPMAIWAQNPSYQVGGIAANDQGQGQANLQVMLLLPDGSLQDLTQTDARGMFQFQFGTTDNDPGSRLLVLQDACGLTQAQEFYLDQDMTFFQFQVCDPDSGGGGDCQFDFGYYQLDATQPWVQFELSVWGSFQSVTWDFGDGTTSQELAPQHLYPGFGEYYVTVTLEAEDCSSTLIGIVTLQDQACFADFGWEHASPDLLSLNFYGYTYGLLDQFAWDFGDGTTATGAEASHTYAQEGTYTVTLTATSDSLQCFATASHEVQAGGGWNGECQAYFYYEVTDPENLGVQFYDYSWGIVDQRQWDFGDGATSQEQHPYHQYDSPQTYQASLAIASETCQATASFHVWLDYLDPGFCQADFWYDYADAEGLTLQFYDYSYTNQGAQYLWEFGDGATSQEQFPAHTYAQEGAYTARLTITTPDCQSVAEYEVFAGDSWYHGCDVWVEYELLPEPANTVAFRASSSEALGDASFFWDFGDGATSDEQNPTHTYPAPGLYLAYLIYQDQQCHTVAVAEVWVNDSIGPVPTDCQTFFYMEPTDEPMTFHFHDMSMGQPFAWVWSFGDGATSQEQNPTYTYDQPGNHTVTLTTIGHECQSSFAMEVLVGEQWLLDLDCQALFFPIVEAPGDLDIQFVDMSIGPIANWDWDFGDGTTSQQASPSYQFASPNTYMVSQTVSTADGCTSQITVMLDLLTGQVKMMGPGTMAQTAAEGLRALAPAKLYPNPAADWFRLDFQSPEAGTASAAILDLAGRTVRQSQAPAQAGPNAMDFDVSDLPSGFYTLRVVLPRGQVLNLPFVH